jgi:hypothetical protein
MVHPQGAEEIQAGRSRMQANKQKFKVRLRQGSKVETTKHTGVIASQLILAMPPHTVGYYIPPKPPGIGTCEEL